MMKTIQVSVFVALTFARVESNFYPIAGNAYYDPTTLLTATTVPLNRNLSHVPSINDGGGGGSGDFKSRFYSHDELGQYTNGYDDRHRSKIESKTLDGFTQGSYSYVDTNGGGGGNYEIRNVLNYVPDDVDGFRMTAATRNLPSTASSSYVYQFPIRPNAFVTHQNPIQTLFRLTRNSIQNYEITSTNPAQTRPSKRAVTFVKRNATENIMPESRTFPAQTAPTSTIANVSPTSNSFPLPQLSWFTNPIVPVTMTTFKQLGILSPVHQQFHTQDDLGQYSYGYSGGPSTKVETKTSDGITRGGYSYVDPNGILQTVNYVSDPINGFRVAGTNLPTISNYGTASYPNKFQYSH